MAEYLGMDAQVIRQRLENAMQQWERLAEMQIQSLHARLDTLLFNEQQRFVEVAWRLEGMNPSVPDQFEGFYAALDDMRDDRVEYAEARQQERGHEHGMGY
jgi:hypothetical protein